MSMIDILGSSYAQEIFLQRIQNTSYSYQTIKYRRRSLYYMTENKTWGSRFALAYDVPVFDGTHFPLFAIFSWV